MAISLNIWRSSAVDVREARVVPDVEQEIVAAVNALRARYDYVITTGGIGPTHDDITADSIGRAFGVAVGEDPRAIAIMLERYAPGDLTPARRRMARMPEGADLIETRSPGRRAFESAMCTCSPACPRSCRRCSTSLSNRCRPER